MQIEEKYMARCIALARKGAGYTSPNPMVGAVIVHNGQIIGEGYHRKCGEAHAEVNAVNAVKDESLLTDSTLYVSLEPCSHFGKTPPCADLIISKQIPRVVVGSMDPFPEVSGRGIRRLREAGVEVVTGVLEAECWELNRFFFTFQTSNRPYILMKWAQSQDGFIDGVRSEACNHPVTLSAPETMRQVHKLRAEVDAIMVGTQTVISDNPSLNVRYWSGKNPLRVILDRTLRIPLDSKVFDGSVPTVVFTQQENISRPGVEYVKIDFSRNLLSQITGYLASRKIQSLLVEGGAQLLNTFMAEGLWDEIRVETSCKYLKDGVAAPVFDKIAYQTLILGDSKLEFYKK